MFDFFRKKKWKATVSEEIWVRKAKRGDATSYGRLYLKYLEGIYRYIFFRVNQRREDAEDLTEIVFFKAWENMKNFKEKNFRAWIYQIAHNSIVDFYKSKKETAGLREDLVDTQVSVEEKVILRSEVETVEKALNLLSDDQKAVLTMKFIDDLSNGEIALILGKNEDTIRMIQHRGLKRLRELVKKV